MLRIRLLPDCLPTDHWRERKLADRADIQRHHNSHLVEVLWLVMGALKIWKKRHSCQKKKKKGSCHWSDGDVRMEVRRLLGPC